MGTAVRWIGGATALAALAAAAFVAGRLSAPSATVAVETIARSAAPPPPRAPRVRAAASATEERTEDSGVAVAAAPATDVGATPATAPTPPSVAALRTRLAAFAPPPPGKTIEGDPYRDLREAARATQRNPERIAELWSLLATEEDPAVLCGLVALMRFRPLSPMTTADRDRAWDLLLRDGHPDRRLAAATLWLLGEAWTPSADRKDRILSALDGAVPYEALGPVMSLIEDEALARDADVHDALVRAVDRAPPGADVSRLTPSLSNPWVRHDPYRDLVEAWRKAENAERRAQIAAAYASQLLSTRSGGFADGPPVRARPVDAPVVRSTVEIYAATVDRDVRIRIAAGVYGALRLDDAGRRVVYRELAGTEPDAALRGRLERLAADPAGVHRDSNGNLDAFLGAADDGSAKERR